MAGNLGAGEGQMCFLSEEVKVCLAPAKASCEVPSFTMTAAVSLLSHWKTLFRKLFCNLQSFNHWHSPVMEPGRRAVISRMDKSPLFLS